MDRLPAARSAAAAHRAGDGDRPADAPVRRAGSDWTAVARSSRSRSSYVFVAVQWPFADFLMSPWARNWIFAHRPHGLHGAARGIQERWYQINPPDNLVVGLPIALVLAFVSARRGLCVGQLDGAGAAMSRCGRPRRRSAGARLSHRAHGALAVLRSSRWRTSAAPTRSSQARPVPIRSASASGFRVSSPDWRRSSVRLPARRGRGIRECDRRRDSVEPRTRGRAAARRRHAGARAIRSFTRRISGSWPRRHIGWTSTVEGPQEQARRSYRCWRSRRRSARCHAGSGCVLAGLGLFLARRHC